MLIYHNPRMQVHRYGAEYNIPEMNAYLCFAGLCLFLLQRYDYIPYV